MITRSDCIIVQIQSLKIKSKAKEQIVMLKSSSIRQEFRRTKERFDKSYINQDTKNRLSRSMINKLLLEKSILSKILRHQN